MFDSGMLDFESSSAVPRVPTVYVCDGTHTLYIPQWHSFFSTFQSFLPALAADHCDCDDEAYQQQDEEDGSSDYTHRIYFKDGFVVIIGALGLAQLSPLLVGATAGNVGLDVEAVALPSVQISQCYHIGLRDVGFLASALIFPIGDHILQLVREDIPYVQLATAFKYSCEWVSHVQGSLLFVFTYLQLKVRFAYFTVFVGAESW